jgi:hypothetical protein
MGQGARAPNRFDRPTHRQSNSGQALFNCIAGYSTNVTCCRPTLSHKPMKCPACRKPMVDCVQCSHCGRLYYEANQLNQLLNVCLAIALFMLGWAVLRQEIPFLRGELKPASDTFLGADWMVAQTGHTGSFSELFNTAQTSSDMGFQYFS